MKLGWTELSWNGVEAAPPSTSKTWKELTEGEREAASSDLCYFKDNWDGIDMTPNNGPFLYPKVKSRYVEWDNLSASDQRTANDSLQYTKSTWNNLGTAEIEKRSWDQLTERQKSDAITLGFYQRTWDCFHNHYRGYEWDDLDRDSRDALQVLGWNEINWEVENAKPPSYENEWSRLSENEQDVASVLCFFEDNWDGNSLEEVGVVITEDGSVINKDGVVIEQVYGASDDDGSNNNGGPGGTSGTSGTGASQGQGAGSVSDMVSPNDPATSSSEQIGTARTIFFLTVVALGTSVQMW